MTFQNIVTQKRRSDVSVSTLVNDLVVASKTDLLMNSSFDRSKTQNAAKLLSSDLRVFTGTTNRIL